MAETSIFGINSNLDTQDIINKLVLLEARPLEIVDAKRAIESAKLTAFQDLKSRLQTFKSAVTNINTTSRLLSSEGNFSNNNALDVNQVVDITTTNQTSSGTFSFSVSQLATESKIISAGFATTTTEIKKGQFSIEIGGTTQYIKIDDSNDTLDGLRLAINNSGANVKASFLNDGATTDPVRLLVSGTKTGSDNAVTVRHFNSLIGAGDVDATTFTQTQTGQNASLVVDGVSISKSSNTVTDVLDGAALTLKSAGSGVITLATDFDDIQNKITDFVDAYNDLVLHLKDELSLDIDKDETGVLFGNFTVQNLQQTLRDSVTSQVQGVTGDYQYLAQIGIKTQSDGTLLVDTGDLADALTTDVTNVSQLFASTGATTSTSVTFVGFTNDTVAGTYDLQVSNGTPQLSNENANTFVNATGSGNFFAGASGTDAEGLNFRISTVTNGTFGTITISLGIAETLNRVLINLTDTSLDGPLSAEIDTATDSIRDFDETILEMEERLLLFEENLKQRFTNLEIVLGRLNSQKDAFDNALPGIQSLFSGKR